MNENIAEAFAAAWSALISVSRTEPPTEDVVRQLRESELLADWPLAVCDVGVELQKEEARQAWADVRASRATFGEIMADHFQLFVGPAKPCTVPWESYYRTPQRLLFQETTIDVREFYRRFDLELRNIHNEPDDHIAYELEFCRELLARGLAAVDAGEHSEAQRYFAAHDEFYTVHLSKWAAQFFGLVNEKAQTDFYQAIGALGSTAIDQLGAVS